MPANVISDIDLAASIDRHLASTGECHDMAPSGVSLNWWLDINEYSSLEAAVSPNPTGDGLYVGLSTGIGQIGTAAEGTLAAAVNRISIPLDFVENEVLSVQDFVDRIQCRFDWHAERHIGNRQYEITALLTHPESLQQSTRSATAYIGNTVERRAREITVKYTIENTTDAGKFSLSFKTGPHGAQPSEFTQAEGSLDIEVGALPEVVELPFFTTQTIVLDKPPLPPDVNLIPYKNINNKILILLNANSGRLEQLPQPIEDQDIEGIKKQYLAQILTNKSSDMSESELTKVALKTKLEFRSDDLAYRYEIFRTTVPPSSYGDFAGKKIADVMEHISGNRFASSTSYLDTIVPNKKYYYCFRSLDNHLHVSNPTSVFQVEMVDNSGQVYLTLVPYVFPSPKKEHFTKKGRKYLYIAPSFAQTSYDRNSTAIQYDPNSPPPSDILGSAVDSIWNKNFKIRLTSKKTGKKLDLNLVFKNTGVFNP